MKLVDTGVFFTEAEFLIIWLLLRWMSKRRCMIFSRTSLRVLSKLTGLWVLLVGFSGFGMGCILAVFHGAGKYDSRMHALKI